MIKDHGICSVAMSHDDRYGGAVVVVLPALHPKAGREGRAPGQCLTSDQRCGAAAARMDRKRACSPSGPIGAGEWTRACDGDRRAAEDRT